MCNIIISYVNSHVMLYENVVTRNLSQLRRLDLNLILCNITRNVSFLWNESRFDFQLVHYSAHAPVIITRCVGFAL